MRPPHQEVDGAAPPTLSRETLRLFEAAKAWLAAHKGSVNRTHTPWGEHVAVFLPTGVSAQFTVKEPGDYEEGLVLAVDEIRG